MKEGAGLTDGVDPPDDSAVTRLSPVGSLVIDRDGRLVRVNPAFCALAGRAEPDLAGALLADLTSESSRPPLLARLATRAAGPPWDSRLVRADDTAVDVLLTASPLGGPDGWWVVHAQDVTERRRVESALRASEKALTQVVEASPMAIYTLDPQGRVLLWNGAAERLFGWRADEVVGRMPPTVPPERMEEFQALERRVMAGESLVGLEVEHRSRDGAPLTPRLSTAPVRDSSGRIVATVVIAEDAAVRKAAEQAVRHSEERLRSLLRNVSDSVIVVDADGHVSYFGGSPRPTLGHPDDVLLRPLGLGLVHPDDQERIGALFDEVRATAGAEVRAEFRARNGAGGWDYVETTALNLLDDPLVGGILCTTHVVTERKRAELLLADQARILELIARGAPIAAATAEVAALVEANVDDVTCDLRLLHADGAGGPWGPAAEGQRWTVPLVMPSTGAVLGTLVATPALPRQPSATEAAVLETARNLAAIAAARAQGEQRMAHQALHDGLTDLPNRSLLLDRLAHALRQASRSGGRVAVVFLDLDRFKVVNDSLGHGAGDELLLAVARRLCAAVRPGDTVARFGGDEFVVVCERIEDEHDARTVADRIHATLAQPVVLGDESVVISASVGIAVASAAGVDPDDLLRDADAAMYRAKDRGRARTEVFDEGMRGRAVARLQLEADLRRALEHDELVVHYQPIIDLEAGGVVGAEALVRWRHPDGRLLLPPDFIAVAEETGLIVPLGTRVLDLALADAERWLELRGGEPLELAVNLSARHLVLPPLADQLGELLRRHDWPPSYLYLELTEGVLMEDAEVTLSALDALRRLGVRLAVDDFGTGYSSLGYLHRFTVDVVKIDRTFVAGVGRGDLAIVGAVLAMAEALDLDVVAEGVEDLDQLAAVRRLGCHRAQGHLFSPAVPGPELLTILEAAPTW